MSNANKFGWIRGGKVSIPLNMGASEVLYAASGRFVTNDASGRGEVAGAASTALQGFVESGDLTCSSTEGQTVLNCILDLTAVFRLPLAYDASTYDRNYSSALNGELCDLVVVNGIQYANVSASSRDIVRIVGGQAASAAWTDGSVTGLRLGDGYVDLMLVDGTLYGLGVE